MKTIVTYPTRRAHTATIKNPENKKSKDTQSVYSNFQNVTKIHVLILLILFPFSFPPTAYPRFFLTVARIRRRAVI